MRVPRTFERVHTHLSKPSRLEDSLPTVLNLYTLTTVASIT